MVISKYKFSVIVTLYNKELYIARAIESIIKQSLRDFEIVLVDDCSTDNGLDVAKGVLSSEDIPCQIIERTRNGGSCAPVRMTGCRYAQGDLYAFLDADDEWAPEFLARINRLAETFPEAEAFATDRVLIVDSVAQKSLYGKCNASTGDHIIDLEHFLYARKDSDNPFRVQGMAFRPEALDDIGGFIHAPRSSDVDLMFRFFLSGKKAAWSPYQGLIVHRVSESTVAKTKYQNTRPWFYTVAHAIHRGQVPQDIRQAMMRDVMRRKFADVQVALADGVLSVKWLNNIYPLQFPLKAILIFLACLIPNRLQEFIASVSTIMVKNIFRIPKQSSGN